MGEVESEVANLPIGLLSNQRMPTDPSLPNLFLIGGKKCGTTSLFRALDAHPDIAFPYKEIHFFTYADASQEQRAAMPPTIVTEWQDYVDLYRPLASRPVRGDGSPSYLHSPEAAGRIRSAVPDARIVAVLRHPVERMFSDWLHERRGGREPAESFEEALEVDGAPGRQQYRLKSSYSQHIERFRSLFDEEQLQFLVYEDYTADPVAFVQTIYRFVGLDPTFVPPEPDRRTRRSGLAKSGLVERVVRSDRMKRTAATLLPTQLYIRLGYRVYNANTERPALGPTTRDREIERFSDEITRTEELLGRSLPAWRR